MVFELFVYGVVYYFFAVSLSMVWRVVCW